MAEFKARMYRDIVAYFKQHGVSVVNMSWRYNKMPIFQSLKVNGIGENDGERLKLAAKYFEIEKQALYEAIKSAPEILFVCASGNEGQATSVRDANRTRNMLVAAYSEVLGRTIQLQ